jgi:AraC-like DNA-binding protein
MLVFEYTISTFTQLLQDFALLTKSPVKDNKVTVPEKYGSGYFRLMELPGRLEALQINLNLKDGFLVKRRKSDKEYYVFACDKLYDAQEMKVNIDTESFKEENTVRSAMYLVSFLSDLEQYAGPGFSYQSLRVIIPKEWLAKYLKLEKLEESLQRYLALKAASITAKSIDFESQTILDELFAAADDHHLNPMYQQNRIMKLIEIFFSWMYDQMSNLHFANDVSKDDINRMIEAEAALIKDFSVPAPTITELASLSAMSESKLKKNFKLVYGSPPYEYFQKKRMTKARDMFLAGNRSIKDVGYLMGYANMSNFTTAFKKEFNMLPGDFLKQIPQDAAQ